MYKRVCVTLTINLLACLLCLGTVNAVVVSDTPPEACTDGGVRLVGGASGGEGRVEVCVGGEWATICDDGWDLSDARVVCSQLGLGEAVSAPTLASYGQGSGQIAFSDVECLGNESSIFNCSNSGLFNNTCSHREDASVVCAVFRVRFEQPNYTVSEFTGTNEFCIISEPASFEVYADVTTNLTVSAVNGTATTPTDFIVLDDIITISTSSYVCVQVMIVDDLIAEPGADGKTFTLTLTTSDASVELLTSNTTVNIQDNDIDEPSIMVTPPMAQATTGSNVIFMCEILFEGGVRGPYQIAWYNATGGLVTPTNERRLVISDVLVTEAGAMSVLYINSVYASEAGLYSCEGSVDTYVFGASTLQQSFSVNIRLSSPVVFVLPTPSVVYYGRNVTVTCFIAVGIFVNIPVTPVVTWEVTTTSSEGQSAPERFQAEEIIQDSNPGLYRTTLEYNPIQNNMVFKCYGSLQPAAPSLFLLNSGEGNNTVQLDAPFPPPNLVISPLTQAIATASPYNVYTITCSASIPDDIIGFGYTFQWVDFNTQLTFIANETVSIGYSVASDENSLNFVGTLTAEHLGSISESLRIQCRAVETVTGLTYLEVAYADVEVRGPTPPEPSMIVLVVPASELVLVRWTVSHTSYTPEVYSVQYQELLDGSVGPLMSVQVQGTTNLTETFPQYSTVIEGLRPTTEYRVGIMSTNQNGSVIKEFVEFATNSADDVVLLPGYQPSDLLNIPLGASIQLRFRFARRQDGDYVFFSLSHTPLQQPGISYDAETNVVTVSYSKASPSLSGNYLMCRRVTILSKRQTMQFPQFDCSDMISLSVYTPTLTVSTNLLIVDINDYSIESVRVNCTPSDPLSPVRWRTSLGTYDQLSSPYAVFLEPPLSHVAEFPLIVYEGAPPSITEVFVCDLINQDDLSLEVDPQMITVRFIRKPIAILNHDRELPTPAVINTFNLYSMNGEDVVSLRCLSALAPNLVWESSEVPSLPSGVLTQEDPIPFLTISYNEGVGVNNRDVSLKVSPINNRTTGFYSCRSSDSDYSFSASVFTTLEQPFWRFTSPNEFVLPVGATVSFRALYADFSDGFENMGRGFSVLVTFEPAGRETLSVLVDQMTNPLANEFVYSFILSVNESNGQYTVTATHAGIETVYTQTVQVFATVPYFNESDDRVIVRQGDMVTLRCIPNDTNAPVQWAKFPINPEFNLINSRPDLFTLSPPSLNHTLTFNATRVAMLVDEFSGLNDRRQLYDSYYQCGFFRLIDSRVTQLTIQRESVRLHYTGVDQKVYNNTVINIYQRFNDYEYRRNVGDYNDGGDHLDIRCLGAQGNHRPLWFTDNPILRDDLGAVVTVAANNYQVVESSYIARLRLQDIDEPIQGVYTCSSQLTGALQTFTLSDSNPYVVAVSPTDITVVEGQQLTIRFRVAVNSDGNFWITGRTSFYFASSSSILGEAGTKEEVGGGEIEILLQIPDSNYPQDYVYSVPRVGREQDGVYSARVRADDCVGIGCDSAEADIIVTVIPACLEETDTGLLWPDTTRNNAAVLPCTMAGSRFRKGTYITRVCDSDGVWGSVDFTTCTLDDTSSQSLLIVYFSLVESLLPFGPESGGPGFNRDVLESEMRGILDNNEVSHTSVSVTNLLPTGLGVSVSFEIILTATTSQDSLLAFTEYISNGLVLMGFGSYQIDQTAAVGVLVVSPTDSCQCGNTDPVGSGLSINTVELCVGLSLSPCNCGLTGQCTCRPPYAGDGSRCTLDSDGDGYPDEALNSPVCLETTSTPFCVQDNCPNVVNVDQDPFACQEPQDFDGCPFGIDPVWSIEWPNTQRDTVREELCPGALDSVTGRATRYCNPEGEWSDPNVLNCQEMEFVAISFQASTVFAQASGSAAQVAETVVISQQLAVITEPDSSPLLPTSLNTTNNVLSSVLDVLESSGNNSAEANEFVIDILNNILDRNNTQGWMSLQETATGSQLLLYNAERFSELVALSHNNSDQPVRISRPNIAISAKLYDTSEDISSDDLRFPQAEDLISYPSTLIPAEIELPPGLLQERLTQQNGGALPVTFILIQNVEAFLPTSVSGLADSRGASVVITSQVGLRESVIPSQVLQENPISLNFTFNTVADTLEHRCVYWEFSDPVGSGGWVNNGVKTVSNSSSGTVTRVQCASTHLTSFAVLVDVAGGLRNISDAERTALQVVSYIGCVISLICLLITIIFFIAQGKKLFTSVHYFVHLNLSISLFLAYLVFVIGVETAVGSVGGCAFVAVLLHYLFLSAFCWMMCEGVMLYLLLVVVFSTISKKWWFFLLLGYLTPLPFVVITLASRWQYYGVRDDTGNLQFCWLSTEQGTIFGFVAPMLAIMLINVVFLGFALRALWKNQRRQVRRKHRKASDNEKNLRIARAVLLASLVLVPLLGLTWAFGLLTIDSNTTAFAWIFTILNSLQGVAIFFFHVIRNDKVWGKIHPRITSTFRSLTQRSVFKSSVYDATGAKSSTYDASTSERYKSTTDSEIGLGTFKSSGDDTTKVDLSKSKIVEEQAETKIDLGAESDKSKLLTVKEEESGDCQVTASESGNSHVTATDPGDSHMTATESVDSQGSNCGTSHEAASPTSKVDNNINENESPAPFSKEVDDVIANPNALEDSVDGGSKSGKDGETMTSETDTLTSL